MDELRYFIALSLLPKIGVITSHKLLSYIGSVEGIFLESEKNLRKIPGISTKTINTIKDSSYIEESEKEITYCKKHGISIIPYTDESYPSKLKNCDDAPLLLYRKGRLNINNRKTISIVGTRNASRYGIEKCKEIVEGLSPHAPVIISGLAYGIDYQAHKSALQNDLDTVAVVGHSLDKIYPAQHREMAASISKTGAIFSEFHSQTPLDKYNFVTRNRIIAGMSDAVIVIESAIKGGALITAEQANNYNRDVFALPGKTSDTYSGGCNKLIKQHKAHLFETVEDLEYILNWEKGTPKKAVQKKLFIDLNRNETAIADLLKKEGPLNMDIIRQITGFSINAVSSTLLSLEFSGLVKMKPGKVFEYAT